MWIGLWPCKQKSLARNLLWDLFTSTPWGKQDDPDPRGHRASDLWHPGRRSFRKTNAPLYPSGASHPGPHPGCPLFLSFALWPFLSFHCMASSSFFPLRCPSPFCPELSSLCSALATLWGSARGQTWAGRGQPTWSGRNKLLNCQQLNYCTRCYCPCHCTPKANLSSTYMPLNGCSHASCFSPWKRYRWMDPPSPCHFFAI